MKIFGYMPDGREVYSHVMKSENIESEIITLGGSIRRLEVCDRYGKRTDVSLGFDSLEGYLGHTAHFGALIGRYGNRIEGASFELGGKKYELAANNGVNHLHGGHCGFDRKLWNVEETGDSYIILSLLSPDMEEGYPGNLNVRVKYETDEDVFRISYEAKTDRDTLCNLTNHCYFNLAGHGAGNVENQFISISADRFTPCADGLIPTGEISEVTGTPMDLRRMQRIGEHIDDNYMQLKMGGGYDHNYVINGEGFRKAAEAFCEENGIVMQTYTDQPGVQFYTSNSLGSTPVGKDGAVYGRRGAFCLETQHFPDSPHNENFPSTILRPGEKYVSKTEFRFCSKQ